MLAADSGHDDYVLDAKYDYYGRRFATCSSDHSIRVWDQVPEGGWRVTSRIPKVSIDEMYATSVHHCSASRVSVICEADQCVPCGMVSNRRHAQPSRGYRGPFPSMAR